MLDYSRYRFKAEVDWIEVGCRFPSQTQAKYAKKGANYAIGLDPQGKPFTSPLTNSNTSSFWIRFNEPKNFRSFISRIESYKVKHPGVIIDGITGMEISLDAYFKKSTIDRDQDELPLLCAIMSMRNSKHPSDNKRLYHKEPGTATAIPPKVESRERRFQTGHMLGIGNQHDDHFLRAYFKVSDTVDGNRIQLPTDLHRARFEASLRGAQLPCRTFDELEGFNFGSRPVAQYFKFMKPKDQLEGQMVSIAGYSVDAGILSHKKSFQIRTKTKDGYTQLRHRKTSPLAQADRKLNKLVAEALRGLTTRWQRAMKSAV